MCVNSSRGVSLSTRSWLTLVARRVVTQHAYMATWQQYPIQKTNLTASLGFLLSRGSSRQASMNAKFFPVWQSLLAEQWCRIFTCMHEESDCQNRWTKCTQAMPITQRLVTRHVCTGTPVHLVSDMVFYLQMSASCDGCWPVPVGDSSKACCLCCSAVVMLCISSTCDLTLTVSPSASAIACWEIVALSMHLKPLVT